MMNTDGMTNIKTSIFLREQVKKIKASTCNTRRKKKAANIALKIWKTLGLYSQGQLCVPYLQTMFQVSLSKKDELAAEMFL